MQCINIYSAFWDDDDPLDLFSIRPDDDSIQLKYVAINVIT